MEAVAGNESCAQRCPTILPSPGCQIFFSHGKRNFSTYVDRVMDVWCERVASPARDVDLLPLARARARLYPPVCLASCVVAALSLGLGIRTLHMD